MTPGLSKTLGECNELGVALRLNGERIAFDGPASGLPGALLAQLKAHRDELFRYLQVAAKPAPDPIWFVSQRLEVVRYGGDAVRSAQWVHQGDRPCYRLTPAVLCWLGAALDKKFATAPCDPFEKVAILRTVYEMNDYVHAHFRSDEIIHGMTAPRLPKAIKPPEIDS